MIDGLPADVVTPAMAADVDAIAEKAGGIPSDWQKRLPRNSSPYTSTIVFAVRKGKGHPKQVKDWEDVVKPGGRWCRATRRAERGGCTLRRMATR